MQSKSKVTVIGSSIVDLSMKVSRLAKVGETVDGSSFQMALGGKGVNQAVALSRLGIDVTLITVVGTDDFGKRFLSELEKEDITLKYISVSNEHSTGIAFPLILPTGEKSVYVDSGACRSLSPDLILAAKEVITDTDGLLIQLEIPQESVKLALGLANEAGIPTYLNPAPAVAFELAMLDLPDVIIPNRIEARHIKRENKGRSPWIELSRNKGKIIIITRGLKGSHLYVEGKRTIVDAFHVQSVDAVGASDAFCAALMAARIWGAGWQNAAIFASAAAALSTTKRGSLASMPILEEINLFLKSVGAGKRPQLITS
jgi:ribokinase